MNERVLMMTGIALLILGPVVFFPYSGPTPPRKFNVTSLSNTFWFCMTRLFMNWLFSLRDAKYSSTTQRHVPCKRNDRLLVHTQLHFIDWHYSFLQVVPWHRSGAITHQPSGRSRWSLVSLSLPPGIPSEWHSALRYLAKFSDLFLRYELIYTALLST